MTSTLDCVSLTSEDTKNVPDPSIKPFWNIDLFCKTLVYTHDSLTLANEWKYNFRLFFDEGPKKNFQYQIMTDINLNYYLKPSPVLRPLNQSLLH